jgi:transcriptional regulator GlxA family with amidase domain
MAQTEHFVFLLVDEFSHLAFSGAVEPLRIANLVSGKTLHEGMTESARLIGAPAATKATMLCVRALLASENIH